MDPEFLKALELVAEFDRTRPKIIKEFRLYYHDNGTIKGLWETDYPDGEYIVLSELTMFNNTNTNLLRVVNKELKKLDPTLPLKNLLIKSRTGQPVVVGHAALALDNSTEYQDIEYYDRRNY